MLTTLTLYDETLSGQKTRAFHRGFTHLNSP